MPVGPVDNLSPEIPKNLDFKRFLRVFRGWFKPDKVARIEISQQKAPIKTLLRERTKQIINYATMEVIIMSNSSETSIVRNTLIKDAGSYVIPVLIVLASILFSMGNIFSVKAASSPVETISTHTVTVTGGSGVIVGGGSAGVTIP